MPLVRAGLVRVSERAALTAIACGTMAWFATFGRRCGIGGVAQGSTTGPRDGSCGWRVWARDGCGHASRRG